MTELNPTTLRRELLLQSAIEQRLDTLVGLATAAVLKLAPNTQMEESQLRNLLNASLESKSIEVTTNFIRYQIARKERDWGTSPNAFGHTVIDHIVKDIKPLAEDVIHSIILDKTEEDDRAWFRSRYARVYIRLMQLYLGYINRVFSFYKKSMDRERRDPNAVKDAIASLDLVAMPHAEVRNNG